MLALPALVITRAGIFTSGQRFAGPDDACSGSTDGTLSPLSCVGVLSPAAFLLSAVFGSPVAASTLGVDSGVPTPESMPSEALPCAEVGSPLDASALGFCSGVATFGSTPFLLSACAGVPV
ncbi:hypothetical protein XE88_u0004 [Vibrio parahaemolyticus]|nr:hypothetical protein XE88_u0004 [Vibrio parahaemolyticus]